MRSILLASLLVSASAALALSGCGGSSDGDSDEGSGGSTSDGSDESGGSTSSGGAGSDESGGSTSTGGTSDESGGSTSTGGASDESGGSTSTGGVDGTGELLEACYECGDEKCPEQAGACDDAAGCRAYLTCQVECGSDATCLSECDLSTLTQDGIVAVSNYLACTLTDCLSECSGAPE